MAFGSSSLPSSENGQDRSRSEIAKPLNNYLGSLPTTIFTVMTNLANECKSINLGQGFPDDEGPQEMKHIAGQALLDHHNQYPPMLGIPEARQAVAEHSREHCGISVDWQREALITVGATEALASAFLGLLNSGDEVIFFDPQYDSYIPMCVSAGGVPVVVKLNEDDFSIPRADLEAAFSSRTKFVLVNTPHNPTGKVFSREDLCFLAGLCQKWNTYAVLDEVYEHLVFSGHKHVTLRSLPGMQSRCVRIGSAGKTFSFTAWKVGWVTGPAELVGAMAKAHQFLTFTVASNLQRAVAHGLMHESQFFRSLGADLERKRNVLTRRLTRIGFCVLPTQGTYFLVADFRPLLPPGSDADDVDFCITLTREAGVTLIPISAFYASKDRPRHLVRFCFCKDDAKLTRGCDLLEQHFAARTAVAK